VSTGIARAIGWPATPPKPPVCVADVRSHRYGAAAIVLLLCVARLVDPDRPLPIDLCAFKQLTGLPCPGCGLTRSLCHAIRGDWSTSVSYHPAGVLLLAALAGGAVWLAVDCVAGRPVARGARARLIRAGWVSGLAVSLTFWIGRLSGWIG
jgi:hypothetical protein